MCGIAGLLHFDPSVRVDEARLRRMRDVLVHRGPDNAGLMIDGAFGMAHRRLSIIDVAAGHQPMTNEDGSISIVFNGEIYNHADLRPRLEAAGHRYRTRSDTETIIHLYEEKGDRLVDDLHGMFAFAIWDAPRRRLLLARDRLGIKPLYVAVTGSELLFGSEIKALLAGGTIRPVFNVDALPEYLSTRFISGEQTFFQGVQKLLPGHVLTWSAAEGLQRRRYWQVPAPVNERTDAPLRASAGDLRGRLEAAVQSHLMSDVPLGVFLSGGIDSTALAALVARATDTQIQTFAVGFDDPETSELPYARLAAAHVGARHRDVTVTPAQFFDALPRLLWHEDEPIAFPSSVPLYFVARLAADHVKVVLTGEGADELFLGYNRYRVSNWNARLGAPYWAVAPASVRRKVRGAVAGLPPALGRFARRSFLNLEPGIRELYLENFAVFSAQSQETLLRDAAPDARDPYASTLSYYDDAPGSLLDKMSRGDLQTYLHELLMKQDQMSMAASIESRVPFLDDRLVEHVAAMPGHLKLPGWQTKIILRAAVRDLVPGPILTRRKMGFPVPLARWFRSEFRPVVDEFVLGPRAAARGLFDRAVVQRLAGEHAAGAGSHADRLWLLINLEIWNRIFCDGEEPADISRAMQVSGQQAAGGGQQAAGSRQQTVESACVN